MSATGDRTPRKKIDLSTLPTVVQYVIAITTVAVVVALALLVGDGTADQGLPVTAVIVAAGVFALLAWRRQHP